MNRNVGLTAAVLAAMSDGQWYSCASVCSAVPAQYRNSASTILGQLWKHGRAERRGEHRAYEYRLLPGAKARALKRGYRDGPSTDAAAVPVPVPALRPLQGPAVFAASLGTTAGQLTPYQRQWADGATPPANPAQGRIEDVLAAVLDKRTARKLDQLLPDVPNGWSRLDLIGGIADGVIEGWIRAVPAGQRDAYLLLRDPPPVRANPQVEQFKAHRLLEQCKAMDDDAAETLVSAREYDAPYELVRALMDLRRAIARTVQQLSPASDTSPAATGIHPHVSRSPQ